MTSDLGFDSESCRFTSCPEWRRARPHDTAAPGCVCLGRALGAWHLCARTDIADMPYALLSKRSKVPGTFQNLGGLGGEILVAILQQHWTAGPFALEWDAFSYREYAPMAAKRLG